MFSIAVSSRQSMEALATWMAEGVLRPVIAARYPLREIADAHSAAEGRRDGAVVVFPQVSVPL